MSSGQPPVSCSRSRAKGRLAEVRRERLYRQPSIGWGNMSRSLVCSEALVHESWLRPNSQRVSVACQLRGKMAFGIPVPKVMVLEDSRANLTCLHPTSSVLDIFHILEYHSHSTFSNHILSCELECTEIVVFAPGRCGDLWAEDVRLSFNSAKLCFYCPGTRKISAFPITKATNTEIHLSLRRARSTKRPISPTLSASPRPSKFFAGLRR